MKQLIKQWLTKQVKQQLSFFLEWIIDEVYQFLFLFYDLLFIKYAFKFIK
jgi:hypothetical protein